MEQALGGRLQQLRTQEPAPSGPVARRVSVMQEPGPTHPAFREELPKVCTGCWLARRSAFISASQKLESTQPHDDWELDPRDIELSTKVASGAFGDLYKGTYCGQDVAIKILRNVQDDSQQYQEFLQVWRCCMD